MKSSDRRYSNIHALQSIPSPATDVLSLSSFTCCNMHSKHNCLSSWPYDEWRVLITLSDWLACVYMVMYEYLIRMLHYATVMSCYRHAQPVWTGILAIAEIQSTGWIKEKNPWPRTRTAPHQGGSDWLGVALVAGLHPPSCHPRALAPSRANVCRQKRLWRLPPMAPPQVNKSNFSGFCQVLTFSRHHVDIGFWLDSGLWILD